MLYIETSKATIFLQQKRPTLSYHRRWIQSGILIWKYCFDNQKPETKTTYINYYIKTTIKLSMTDTFAISRNERKPFPIFSQFRGLFKKTEGKKCVFCIEKKKRERKNTNSLGSIFSSSNRDTKWRNFIGLLF